MKSLFSLLLLLICNFSLSGESYVVKLERTWDVGDKYLLSSTHNSQGSTKILIKNKIVDNNEYLNSHSELKAKVTVLKLNKDKFENIIKIEIIEFKNKKNEILPEGTVLIGKAHQKSSQFFINERRLDERIEAALSSHFALGTKTVSLDKLYGSASRKEIGESWGVNTEEILLDFSKYLSHLKENDISGKVTLLKKGMLRKVECLEFQGEVNIANIDNMKPPENMKMIESNVKNAFTMKMPVDVSNNYSEGKLTMIIKSVMEGRAYPDEPIRQVVDLNKVFIEQRYQPIK